MKKIAVVRAETLTDDSIVFNVHIGDEIVATPRKQYEADGLADLINRIASDPCVREDLFTAFTLRPAISRGIDAAEKIVTERNAAFVHEFLSVFARYVKEDEPIPCCYAVDRIVEMVTALQKEVV